MDLIATGLGETARRAPRAVILLVTGLLMSGCAAMGDFSGEDASFAAAAPAEAPEGRLPQSELQKATAYWAERYGKKPTDRDAGLSYARNLKALGQKEQALQVLQQTAIFFPSDREVASEYGRLALEFDKVSIAEQFLAQAEDPTRPDWRVTSARGTVLSKQGRYKEAIAFYERALQMAPGQSSVLNNLALAYAMNGEPERAEGVLRQAVASGNASPKVRQNLALVLGLQGKYDEATRVGSEAGSNDLAAANTDVIKQIVKLPAKATPTPASGTWEPVVQSASATGSAQVWQTQTQATPRKSAPRLADATPAVLGPPIPVAAEHANAAPAVPTGVGAPVLRPATN